MVVVLGSFHEAFHKINADDRGFNPLKGRILTAFQAGASHTTSFLSYRRNNRNSVGLGSLT